MTEQARLSVNFFLEAYEKDTANNEEPWDELEIWTQYEIACDDINTLNRIVFENTPHDLGFNDPEYERWIEESKRLDSVRNKIQRTEKDIRRIRAACAPLIAKEAERIQNGSNEVIPYDIQLMQEVLYVTE
jgi:hypothetical protein